MLIFFLVLKAVLILSFSFIFGWSRFTDLSELFVFIYELNRVELFVCILCLSIKKS